MVNKSFFAKQAFALLCKATCMSLCCFTLTLEGAAAQPLAQTATDFTFVAKEAMPAVVSIKVRSAPIKKTKNSIVDPWGANSSDGGGSEFFNDEFLKRFFGLPDEQSLQPTVGQASGFIISADGFILTNAHVVKDTGEVTVILNDGREFNAQIVGQDPGTDIAVVKIDVQELPFLTFANSDDLQIGQWAIAIGNPLGLQASLTVGVISATGRNNLDLARIEDFIQTDAAINRGNSGGPLLNLDAKVIGMNTAIVTNIATGGYMGIGFAIPSNLIIHIMNELIAHGKVTRGFLGVLLQQMDANLAKAFNLDRVEGALVAEVSKDSPADRAGLKQGDIVLKLNNNRIVSIAALRNSIALMPPGAHISLTVLRNGKTIDIPIEIGTVPKERETTPAVPDLSKENKFGFSVQDLTPEIARSLGYGDEKGVIVSYVEGNSVASWAGLKRGSLILSANQQKITSAEAFSRFLESMPKDKPLLLLVKQGDIVRFISLQAS